jgi:hypothetical protein
MSKQSPILCCDEAAAGGVPVREIHNGGPFDLRPEYICRECYSPQQIGGDDSTGFPAACGVMDGPAWDELGPVVTL